MLFWIPISLELILIPPCYRVTESHIFIFDEKEMRFKCGENREMGHSMAFLAEVIKA